MFSCFSYRGASLASVVILFWTRPAIFAVRGASHADYLWGVFACQARWRESELFQTSLTNESLWCVRNHIWSFWQYCRGSRSSVPLVHHSVSFDRQQKFFFVPSGTLVNSSDCLLFSLVSLFTPRNTPASQRASCAYLSCASETPHVLQTLPRNAPWSPLQAVVRCQPVTFSQKDTEHGVRVFHNPGHGWMFCHYVHSRVEVDVLSRDSNQSSDSFHRGFGFSIGFLSRRRLLARGSVVPHQSLGEKPNCATPCDGHRIQCFTYDP